MKINTITSSISRSSGGVGTAVKSIVQALQQSACDVALCCLLEDDTFEGLSDDRQYTIVAETLSGLCLPGGSRGLDKQFRAYMPRCDIVHCNCLWESCLWSAAAVAQKCNKPYLVSPHGMLDAWAIHNSKWKKKIVGWLFANQYLRKAACIHALCESEHQSIRAYGLTNPVAIIPNGIDLPLIKPGLEPLWREMIPAGQKVMLFLGRIHPKKGLVNLIEAWSKTRPAGWALAIAGWDQGGHEDELKKRVAELGLEKDIIFLGPVFDEKKQACLQHADAFVLPSFSEGLPMSVLEAWAYGLPVIKTAECNIPAGFAAKAAIEIRPGVDSIAKGLTEFIKLTEAQQKQMGQNGLHLVKERFAWPKIATQMIDVYKWVLGQGVKPDFVQGGHL